MNREYLRRSLGWFVVDSVENKHNHTFHMINKSLPFIMPESNANQANRPFKRIILAANDSNNPQYQIVMDYDDGPYDYTVIASLIGSERYLAIYENLATEGNKTWQAVSEYNAAITKATYHIIKNLLQ